MPRSWSAKRKRQYEHVKDSLHDRGVKDDKAEEIAARTVNKERARHGEAKTSSRSSTDDISSGRRGGLRSHKGPGGRTYDQLYNEAKRRGLKGRSSMNKAELEKRAEALTVYDAAHRGDPAAPADGKLVHERSHNR